MKVPALLALSTLFILPGCASLMSPPSEKLAALPVVSYPENQPAGDFVYKLPAGKPIEIRVRADGSALAAPVAQTVSASLTSDLYLHGQWASEDGRTWQRADQLVGVNLRIVLPSQETPGPGDIHLTVDRKTGR